MRQFAVALTFVAISASSVALAQSVPTVGYLHTQSAKSAEDVTQGFRKGLEHLGFVEHRNVSLEYRFANGDMGKLPALAAELIQRKVGVIAAMGGSRAALAAKEATATIPIVFTMGDADPVQVGMAASLAHPGGNATGISLLGGVLGAKRLELLRELVPTVKTIAILVNPESKNARSELAEVERAITTAGQTAVVVVSGLNDSLDAAFREVKDKGADALVVTADPIFTNRRQQLTSLALQHAMPAIYQWHLFVAAGGLISYGADVVDIHRQAGAYTGRVLKGEKPADLPVQQAVKFQMSINLKTAKVLGITVPATLLARADEGIE
jgi:putative ABC transport system substrate-binding protein